MVEVGGEAGPAEVPAVPRPLSALRLGLLRLFRALVAREPLPQSRAVQLRVARARVDQ